MPTYEYECDSCGHRFEKVQSFSEKPLRECPVCEGPVRKVFYPVGIIFKGSGWYVTDSRQSSPTAGNGAKVSSEKKATESKPEDKAAGDKEKVGTAKAEGTGSTGKATAE